MLLCMYVHSGRNKDQKLVSRFLEKLTFYRLLIAVPLKMYSKYGRPNRSLIDQMVKLDTNGQLLFQALVHM